MRVGLSKILFSRSISRVVALGLIVTSVSASAQESPDKGRKTTEPVFRVSKLNENDISSNAKDVFKSGAIKGISAKEMATHPLDKAVSIARVALGDMRQEVTDYTALLVRREQVNGVVGEPGYIQLKIRCPRETAAGRVPFSIYMKFLKPRAAAGREVIWVEGRDDSRLCVHEGRGILSMRRFLLDPDGALAMKDNRYPIYEAGLENLIIKLIEKAERDRQAGPCHVDYRDGAVINKRPCSVIELLHEHRKAPYEFYKAQVFIDQELNLPIRYAAYDWPSQPNGKPKLIEEYTYVNVKVNVGLTDMDFNPDNPAYKFPRK